ncbi:MAG: DUF362 domain-containing protein [Lentisphaeria bacterium]|jgi:uncharacterized protein (DUF362 family)/Pyruvate/2-oxoacid:ferredoxin oxidoreductase delta subunit
MAPLSPPPACVAAIACDSYESATVEAALRQALAAAVGGLEGVVKPGMTVLLKPNLLSARPPEQAVTTHPAVVAAMARLCREAGAARVWIGDSPAGLHPEAVLWERTGMAAAAAASGAELKSFAGAVVPRPVAGTHLPVPAWLAEVDVLINLPKLKTHGLTVLTCALKNPFGLVCGEAKAMCHAKYPSPRSMAGFLVEWFAAVRPALTVVDAVVALEGDGPANGAPRPLGVLVAGTDAVAVDAVCARALRVRPAAVPMLRLAAARGLGEVRHERITVRGDGAERLAAVRLKPSKARWLQWLPEPVFQLATRLLRCRPEIAAGLCVQCGICIGVCPRQAIHARAGAAKAPERIDNGACILCMCCVESCPRHAIRIRSPLDLWNRLVGGQRGRL